MSIEKEKEMFEAWYEKHHNGRQISCDYVREENSYSIGYANAMWISWQASANREGYKLVLVEPTDVKLKEFQKIWFDSGCAHIMKKKTAFDLYKAMIGEETK